jgi:DNA-binding IclR family transcriptional regulator
MDEMTKGFKVPALEKGLQILETLSSALEPMSLTEISHVLGRSPSELFRMIGYLEARGYIKREQHSGNYYLSLKLYELAHTHSPVEQMIRAAIIPMRELAMKVRESCHLSVLHEGNLLVLYQQESPEKYRFSVEVGSRYDVLSTVSGRLLLAYLSADEREYYLSVQESFKEAGAEERSILVNRLEEIVEKGFSYSEHETHMGIRDLAVLVGNPKVGLAASLAIPSLIVARAPKDTEDLLRSLQDCARKITVAMGIEME